MAMLNQRVPSQNRPWINTKNGCPKLGPVCSEEQKPNFLMAPGPMEYTESWNYTHHDLWIFLGTLRPFFFRHRKIQKDLVIDSLSTSTNSVRYSIVHDVGTSSGSRLGESCPKLPKSEEFGELGWTWSRKMPKIGQFSIFGQQKGEWQQFFGESGV